MSSVNILIQFKTATILFSRRSNFIHHSIFSNIYYRFTYSRNWRHCMCARTKCWRLSLLVCLLAFSLANCGWLGLFKFYLCAMECYLLHATQTKQQQMPKSSFCKWAQLIIVAIIYTFRNLYMRLPQTCTFVMKIVFEIIFDFKRGQKQQQKKKKTTRS